MFGDSMATCHWKHHTTDSMVPSQFASEARSQKDLGSSSKPEPFSGVNSAIDFREWNRGIPTFRTQIPVLVKSLINFISDIR